MTNPQCTILAGGVGGARMVQGFSLALTPECVTSVINTADDFTYLGLRICPDLDTNMYTLANLSHRERGWGVQDDTQHFTHQLNRYNVDTWFSLGDFDMATHLLRTSLLSERRDTIVPPPSATTKPRLDATTTCLTLTEVTQRLCANLGVTAHILPMCNEEVRTVVHTDEGNFYFQEYYVLRQHRDVVRSFTYENVENSSITSEVQQAITNAQLIVVAPSNPYVSIAPILLVPGIRAALDKSSVPKVAVSPLIGDRAIKGPLADMMRSLGYPISSVGIALLYANIVDYLVIDSADAALADDIEALGIHPLVMPTLMDSRPASRQLLAERILQQIPD